MFHDRPSVFDRQPARRTESKNPKRRPAAALQKPKIQSGVEWHTLTLAPLVAANPDPRLLGLVQVAEVGAEDAAQAFRVLAVAHEIRQFVP